MIDKVVLLDKAVTLGQIYGSKTDTVVYTQGVGLSARLRLEKLGYFTGAKDFALEFYNELINGRINKEGGGMMSVLPKGTEMDYRGGGMIPMGSKERADDVPARLSENEFVMTADAVRAAGGGSVNEGAKRMYKVMNDLEARA